MTTPGTPKLTDVEAAVLAAVVEYAPHAALDDIERSSGLGRRKVRASLDIMQAVGLMEPPHWNDGSAVESATDLGRLALKAWEKGR